MAWPMPKLGGRHGSTAGLLRLLIMAPAVVLLGPATLGWGALGGVVIVSAWYIWTDRAEGALRAAIAMPLLYFGALTMVLQGYFNDDHAWVYAAAGTAGPPTAAYRKIGTAPSVTIAEKSPLTIDSIVCSTCVSGVKGSWRRWYECGRSASFSE